MREAEVARRRVERLVDGEREGRAAELGRIEAEEEVMHDRVADRRSSRRCRSRGDAGLRRDLADEAVDRLAHGRGHLAVAAGMQHHVGDAAHQILAEADLRVHRPAEASTSPLTRSQRCAAMVVEPMSTATPNAFSTRPGQTRDDIAARADGDGDLPAAGAQGLLQRREHGESKRAVPRSAIPRGAPRQPVEVARRIVHVGLGDLDIVEAHRRIGDDRAGCRRALRTTCRWTWLSAARRPRGRRGCAPGSRAAARASARRAGRHSAPRSRPRR